ncbi:hypothetical protein BCR44DRAFT_1448203 [Catenaria anguillulae PL171]|uniref:Bms1-type G domain-containing protein n=1 Tax=Catenaria anguillulae PL171 TaxID=765915 RepID=A0A1Y2H546_9FUNG|nr:hypothetical protein BCR44DRAFT_1448203 [Catenaria anguillulae PL171]
MSSQPHSHRSTLKQSNKPFKGTGGSSKRTLKNKAKGKIERPTDSIHRVAIKKTTVSSEEAKANRRNAAKIAKQNKNAEIQFVSRIFSGRNGAPKIVSVIPLCTDADVHAVLGALHTAMDQSYTPSLANSVVMEYVSFSPSRRDLLEVLDAVKLSDFVVFVLSAQVEVDSFGELLLTSILAQGLPLSVPVVQYLHNATSSPKHQMEIRKSLISYMSFWSPGTEKVYSLDVPMECTNAIRQITDRAPKSISWRDQYPYMIPDKVQPLPPSNGDEQEHMDLAITGFVRGNRLSANRLVHIPGVGDFQVAHVVSASVHTKSDNDMDTSSAVLDAPDENADDLVAENEPDDMMNEQTWPTEAELALANAQVQKKTKRVPKGTSSYQAAWIVDSDPESGDDEVAEEDLAQVEAERADWTFHPRMSENVDWSHVTGQQQPGPSRAGKGQASEPDAMSVSNEGSIGHADDQVEPAGDDDEYEDVELDDRASVWDAKMDAAEQARQLEAYLEERKKRLAEEEQDEMEFPDEVETPLSVPAKVRFARYRGLKSIRKSPWDPYENLPRDYARLFQFENWFRTRARVSKEQREDAAVGAGSYVTLTLRNVPTHVARVFHMPTFAGQVPSPDGPKALFWVVGLLEYEHKYTTLHFSAQRREEYTEPIRSKDPFTVQLGWRRFNVAPVWSEHGRDGGNKVFKFERFLKPKQVSVGTIYAPNTFYGPSLVLLPGVAPNPANANGDAPVLVATGSVMSADASRILAKRVVLTGHPYKLHRKIAVIRWMFYSPEDVLWFKPVQLHTKYGRTGHIRESLGTHGYMKCIFDGPVQQNDTVCMNLYKRMFPKVFATLLPPMLPGSDSADTWAAPLHQNGDKDVDMDDRMEL